MVLLGVENEAELKRWRTELSSKAQPLADFVEPDLDNQLTAIACLPDDGRLFRKLRLL